MSAMTGEELLCLIMGAVGMLVVWGLCTASWYSGFGSAREMFEDADEDSAEAGE